MYQLPSLGRDVCYFPSFLRQGATVSVVTMKLNNREMKPLAQGDMDSGGVTAKGVSP